MSGGWRFALSRRWLGYAAFAVAFAIACGLLASWQLARSKEAAAANAVIARNFDAAPVPLPELVAASGGFRAADEWRPVTVRGEYLADEQFLVRNRPLNGSPGFEVLVPLRQADGTILVVDRGWVGAGDHEGAAAVPAPPAGTVTVTARLRPAEPTPGGQTRSGRQLASIRPAEIRDLIGGAVLADAYGVLVSESPAPRAAPQRILTTPPLRDEGLHWSYMVQWIVFALIGFFGLGYALRVEYRNRNRDDPRERARAEERERRRARTRSDADEEDELLDRAGRL